MITSFEVGAVFKIINQASPALTQILRQIREINLAVDNARKNLALINKPIGIGAAIGETNRLAAAWGDVAANATAARTAIRNASAATARAALALPAGFAGGGGRGGSGQPGWLRGGGHISGPSASIPGGSHVRFGSGAAMAGAGVLGYGIYQAAEMEKYVWQLIYHSGQDQKDGPTNKRMRGALQEAMIAAGYNIHDVGEAALTSTRMFQGTPGKGLDVLPDMLETASKEALAKGSSLAESMKSFIGLAHMAGALTPNEIRKLAPGFAYLSTSNPSSLSSIERAAGYAVPLLRSGLDIDPMDTLLLGTALTRSGATSTKSGTWLREMALRAMPGTSMMSKLAFRKHEEALTAFGLIDGNHKPTWFTDGKPDIFKMLDIAGDRAKGIPIEKRAAYERALFGAQGGGGFALLANPAVHEQILAMRKEMNSSEFKNRYSSFLPDYAKGSTAQRARTTLQEFNVTMGELGMTVLPAVNGGLKDFKALLEGLRGILPGATKPGAGEKMGTRALEGAVVGAGTGFAIGKFGGPAGALSGTLAGGVLGAAYSFLEQSGSLAKGERPADRYERKHAGDPSLLGAVLGILKSQAAEKHETAGERYERRIAKQANAAPEAKLAPLALTINLDGRTLAQAMSNSWYSFPTQGTGRRRIDAILLRRSQHHGQVSMAITSGAGPHQAWLNVNDIQLPIEHGSVSQRANRQSSGFNAVVPMSYPGARQLLATMGKNEATITVLTRGMTATLITGEVDTADFDYIARVINVTGRDKSAKLHDKKSSEKHVNKMPSDVVSDLIGRVGLAGNVTSSSLMAGKKLQQDFVHLTDNVSYAYVIHKLAQFDNARWWVDANGKFNYVPFGSPQGIYSISINQDQQPISSDCLMLRICRNIQAGKSIKVKVSAWHPKKKQVFSYTSNVERRRAQRLHRVQLSRPRTRAGPRHQAREVTGRRAGATRVFGASDGSRRYRGERRYGPAAQRIRLRSDLRD
ncbi:hypothetical protein [Nitrobacter sp. TKz-YC02]|uniref:hypothetical protein n=1 Tax=Nitrobacter sp. TKz-YC02 TaxID=3398704 RepID=UPI003CF04501